MITLDIAKKIQDDLHAIASNLEYNITFVIKDKIQRYESDMLTRDNNTYQACVLSLVSDPFIFNDLQLVVSSYELTIYGDVSKRREIEEIFKQYKANNSVKKLINGKLVSLYSSQMFIDDFSKSEDGRNKSKFNGRVDVEINEPLFEQLNGYDTSLMIDDVSLPFNTIRYRKDKSLIPNVQFGNSNIDIKLVNEEIMIEIPVIQSNAKIAELLVDVLNNNYNKSYNLKWQIGTIEADIDMTLRVGTIDYNRNNNPLTFWVTMQRTLARKDFKIDDVTIPVLRWSFNGNVEITSKSDTSGVKSKIIGTGRSVTALLLNDDSVKVNEIIDNLETHNKDKRFALEIDVNDKTFIYNMIIKEGSIQVTEYPDLMLEVTFIEGS